MSDEARMGPAGLLGSRPARLEQVSASDAFSEVNFAVAFELLRGHVRRELAAADAATVARRLRISKTDLEAWMAGGEMSRPLWDAATRLSEEHSAQRVDLCAIGINVLADRFHPDVRVRVRQELARAVAGVLMRLGYTLPCGLQAAAAGQREDA